MASTNWQGWRRQRGSALPWEKIAGALSGSRGEALHQTVCFSDLANCGVIEWEYRILPEGEVPEWLGQTYRNRMLRT